MFAAALLYVYWVDDADRIVKKSCRTKEEAEHFLQGLLDDGFSAWIGK
jgi:hypothetical protein